MTTLRLATLVFVLAAACALPIHGFAADTAGNTMQDASSVLDSMPYVIFFKDLNGVYKGGNRAWEALIGKSRDDVIGKTDFDLFPHDVAESFRAYDQAMLDSGAARSNAEWLVYPDGHKVWVETTKMPWKAADGTVLGLLGICRELPPP